jgi:hypothetical protein
MGANTFFTTELGEDAKTAFHLAVEEALYESGHGGYTGTIAEKSSFVMIECPKGKNPSSFVDELVNNDDPRISDKWGPDGCLDFTAEVKKRYRKAGRKWPRGKKAYLFFGWASE